MKCKFDEFSKNIIDSHIHIGWYDNIFFDIQSILKIILKLNLSMGLLSSISGWKKGMNHAINETLLAVKFAQIKFFPLFWVNPLEEWKQYLNTPETPEYYGVKLHPYANGYTVTLNLLYDFFDYLNNSKKVPVFVHTGNAGCLPSDFVSVVKTFNKLNFILYHGRPIDDAIKVTSQFDNVYIETSYMESSDFRKALLSVGPSKIIFGSDLPMDSIWYPGDNIISKYKAKVERHLELCTEIEALQIFNKNILNIIKT